MVKHQFAYIPQKIIGPIKLLTPQWQDDVYVPLATFETPLWHAVKRGARISHVSQGINVTILNDVMCRSILLQATSARAAHEVRCKLLSHDDQIRQIVNQTSKHWQYDSVHVEQVGNLLYIRIAILPGEAALSLF